MHTKLIVSLKKSFIWRYLFARINSRVRVFSVGYFRVGRKYKQESKKPKLQCLKKKKNIIYLLLDIAE